MGVKYIALSILIVAIIILCLIKYNTEDFEIYCRPYNEQVSINSLGMVARSLGNDPADFNNKCRYFCSGDGIGGANRASLPSSSAICSSSGWPVVPCGPGQYLNGSTCSACPSGTFQDQPDFTGSSCMSVPTTNVASSTSSSVTCSQGFTLNKSNSPPTCDPSPCDAGQFSSSGNQPCTACQDGTYSSPGATSCTSCSGAVGTTGYTTGGSGGTSSASCQAKSCQPGYVLNGAICNACLAGYSSSGGTSSSCTICGDGTYSSAGAATCTQCPSSSYATSMSTGGPGATSSAQCQSSGCSSGYSLSDDKCISIYNKSIKLVQICKPDQTCNYNIPDL